MLQPPETKREGARPDRATHGQKGGNGYHESRKWPAASTSAASLLLLAGQALAIDSDPVKTSWWPTQPYSWTDVVLVGITALYLIVTAIYALISYAQWGVLHETLKETKKSNALALRAVLVIVNVELGGIGVYPEHPTDMYIRVHVHNAGKIPAVSVAVTLKLGTDPVCDPPPAVFPRVFGPEGVVIPANQTPRFVFTVEGLSAAQIASMRRGDLRLMATARLTYTDTLDTKGRAAQGAFYLREMMDGDRESFVLDREDTEIA